MATFTYTYLHKDEHYQEISIDKAPLNVTLIYLLDIQYIHTIMALTQNHISHSYTHRLLWVICSSKERNDIDMIYNYDVSMTITVHITTTPHTEYLDTFNCSIL
jgi:hypothetical protein